MLLWLRVTMLDGKITWDKWSSLPGSMHVFKEDVFPVIIVLSISSNLQQAEDFLYFHLSQCLKCCEYRRGKHTAHVSLL